MSDGFSLFPPDRPEPGSARRGAAGAARTQTNGDNGPGILTVQQVTQMVRAAIAGRLPTELHVAGQISNFTQPAGGHLYFTLKDEASEIRCVMWKSAAAHLKFRPTDGLEVVATGAVDVYEPRGQYQLYAKRLEPRGIGALELAFRQLKEKLGREGLFDPKRKRRLPRFPTRVAVVTSLTGAAVRDIVHTLARRWPVAEVLLYGVRVQGEGAAAEIAEAIRRVNAARERLGGVDVLIVGRGGGSIEDLWAFNEEAVARAIFDSRIPVVSAVGHEVDFTIADFVADVRAATPTAAAEMVGPAIEDVGGEFQAWAIRLSRSMAARLDSARGRLGLVERSAVFRDPIGRLRQRGQALDEIVGRLNLALTQRLARLRKALHDAEVRLTRVRPEAVLARRRERLARIEHRLRWAQGHLNLLCERRLAEMAAKLRAVSPEGRAAVAASLLGQFAGRLDRAMAATLDRDRRAMAALETRLAAASHERVLARGFTITRERRTGRIVTHADAVWAGDRLITQTAEGTIDSVVEDGRQGRLFE